MGYDHIKEDRAIRKDIIAYLGQEVRRRCESKNNLFGTGSFYHIESVVKNGVYLAKEYGADEEIVTIAAWLHDIASITDYALYEDHHIHGMLIAGDILNGFAYDEEKIEKVKQCIYRHRGSRIKEKVSPEEMCVADADASSHFDSVPSLFYLAFANRKLSEEEGINFVRSKLERSYNKLSNRGKDIYREKYENIMRVL